MREAGILTDADCPEGLYQQRNEDYHASAGISKSGLWTLWQKSPAHYKGEEREYKPHFALGSAAHTAILEPEHFEARHHRVAVERRAGKAWDAGCLDAAARGAEALTAGDFDTALRIRDAAGRNAHLQTVLRGSIVETSAFARSPGTGALARCKPDIFNPALHVLVDLKTTIDAHPERLAASVARYGYHVQEPMYSELWPLAGGGPVDGFMFFFFEKAPPYVVKPYELTRGAYQEGYAVYQMAMRRYADCLAHDEWPAYGDEPDQMDLRAFEYRLTRRPDPEPEDFAGLDPDTGEQ